MASYCRHPENCAIRPWGCASTSCSGPNDLGRMTNTPVVRDPEEAELLRIKMSVILEKAKAYDRLRAAEDDEEVAAP